MYVDCSLNRFHSLEGSLLELPELRGLDFSTNLLTNLAGLYQLKHLQVCREHHEYNLTSDRACLKCLERTPYSRIVRRPCPY